MDVKPANVIQQTPSSLYFLNEFLLTERVQLEILKASFENTFLQGVLDIHLIISKLSLVCLCVHSEVLKHLTCKIKYKLCGTLKFHSVFLKEQLT